MESFEIRTEERVEIVGITSNVKDAVDVENGVCTVYVRHTTAGVTVNENESRLVEDMVEALERLVPRGDGYRHDEIDGNADAHLRGMLLDSSVTVPVVDGDPALGTWQSILLFEGDGPRSREVLVECVEE